MKPDGVVRFGLIGLGQHALGAVLPAILADGKTCTVKAVADRSPERLALLPDPDISAFLDYQDLLSQSDVDAIFIATGCDSHHELALAALQAGKHVLVEKPMTSTVVQARELVQTARRCDRWLCVDFEMRFEPENQRIREWIRQGRIGKVQAIHIQSMWDGHKNFGALAARRSRLLEASGGMDCGIHRLDLPRYYTGGSWSQIYAIGTWGDEAFKFPPHISVLAQLDHGVSFTFNGGMGLAAAIKARPFLEQQVIVGNQGVIYARLEPHDLLAPTPPATTLECFDNLGCHIETFPASDESHSIQGVLREFCDLLTQRRLKPEHLATGEDGLEAQIAMDQANSLAVANNRVKQMPTVLRS